MKLFPPAVVGGHVLDEDGDPLTGPGTGAALRLPPGWPQATATRCIRDDERSRRISSPGSGAGPILVRGRLSTPSGAPPAQYEERHARTGIPQNVLPKRYGTRTIHPNRGRRRCSSERHRFPFAQSAGLSYSRKGFGRSQRRAITQGKCPRCKPRKPVFRKCAGATQWNLRCVRRSEWVVHTDFTNHRPTFGLAEYRSRR